MSHDREKLLDFARTYAEAWCSHEPARVAAHFAPGAMIAINGGAPTEITEVARSFITAFPDIQVFMDDVVVKDEVVEFHWTFTGTNTGPDGTGNHVRISGFEAWTFGEDGLVAASLGNYDETEYERQVAHGVEEAE